MGVFAPTAAYLARRLGSRTAITIALALIGAFGIVRAKAPGTLDVVLLTVPVGIGIGLAGAVMPVAVKERFADRPAFATGVYATGITAGAAASTAVAVPLSHTVSGWRNALLVVSGASLALVAAWIALSRDRRPIPAAPRRPTRLPYRRGVAWLLVLVFALNSSVFYAVNSWLPDYYVERGWDQSRAGLLVAVMSAAGIPTGLVVPWFADRVGARRLYLAANSALMLAGLVGLLLAPATAWVWSVVLGIGTGALFPLILTLPLDVADAPAEVGAMGALMLGGGYLLSAVSPFYLGAVRDATGSFTGGFATLAAGVAVMLAATLLLSRTRLEARPEQPPETLAQRG
jgi:CP family cyanate transporter-like MFS transporter